MESSDTSVASSTSLTAKVANATVSSAAERPLSTNTKRVRRKPYDYTAEQKDLMEQIFTNDKYPATATKQIIAIKTGQTYDRVNTWFKNRRSRYKRDTGPSMLLPFDKQNATASRQKPSSTERIQTPEKKISSKTNKLFSSANKRATKTSSSLESDDMADKKHCQTDIIGYDITNGSKTPICWKDYCQLHGSTQQKFPLDYTISKKPAAKENHLVLSINEHKLPPIRVSDKKPAISGFTSSSQEQMGHASTSFSIKQPPHSLPDNSREANVSYDCHSVELGAPIELSVFDQEQNESAKVEHTSCANRQTGQFVNEPYTTKPDGNYNTYFVPKNDEVVAVDSDFARYAVTNPAFSYYPPTGWFMPPYMTMPPFITPNYLADWQALEMSKQPQTPNIDDCRRHSLANIWSASKYYLQHEKDVSLKQVQQTPEDELSLETSPDMTDFWNFVQYANSRRKLFDPSANDEASRSSLSDLEKSFSPV